MGFFSLSATCGICGKECGLNRTNIPKSKSCICPSCDKKITAVCGLGSYNPMSDKIEDIKAKYETMLDISKREFRMRCNVCGEVTCFTLNDLRTNQKLARQAALASGVSTFSAIFGTRFDAYEQGKISNAAASKIVNYTKCPNCNSTDVTTLTDEQWEAEKSTRSSSYASQLSAADELKKFKELLDGGVINQEEFDAKKKQLLGL